MRCSSCRRENLSPDFFKIKRNGMRSKTCKLCSIRKMKYTKRGKPIFDHFMKITNELLITENP